MSALSATKKPNQSPLAQLVISPSPAWIIVLWYGLLHGLIIVSLVLFFTANGWFYSAIVGVLASFYYVSAFYFQKRRVYRLCLDNGHWFVCYENTELHKKIPVTLLRGGFFSPLITILPFKEQAPRGKKTQVIFIPCWVDKESFRQLRVRVGFGEGVR